MIADHNTIYDGQEYAAGDELPDLGSLTCTSSEGNIRDYDGQYADRYKLPKYDDLGTGSSAFLSDNGNFYLYVYYKSTSTWEGNGEVI